MCWAAHKLDATLPLCRLSYRYTWPAVNVMMMNIIILVTIQKVYKTKITEDDHMLVLKFSTKFIITRTNELKSNSSARHSVALTKKICKFMHSNIDHLKTVRYTFLMWFNITVDFFIYEMKTRFEENCISLGKYKFFVICCTFDMLNTIIN